MAEEENKVDEEIRRELNKYIEGVTTQTEDEGIYNKLAELLGKYRREHNKEMIECPICMMEYPKNEMYTVQPCDHKFCLECLLRHINENIDKTNGNIICPEAECTTILNRYELHGNGVIDEKTFLKWEKVAYECLEKTNLSFKKCPNCQAIIQSEKFGKKDGNTEENPTNKTKPTKLVEINKMSNWKSGEPVPQEDKLDVDLKVVCPRCHYDICYRCCKKVCHYNYYIIH